MPDIAQVAPFRLSDYIGQGVQDASGMFRLSEAMQNAPIQRALAQEELKQAPLRTQSAQLNVEAQKQRLLMDYSSQYLFQHQSQVKSGMPEDQSIQEITKTRNAELPKMVDQGLLTPEQADQISKSPFNPQAVQSVLMRDPQYRAALSSERADKALEERIAHDTIVEKQQKEKEDRMARQADETLKLRTKSVNARISHINALIKEKTGAGKLEHDFTTRVTALQKEARSIIGNPNIDANTKAFELEDIHSQLDEMTANLEASGGQVPASVSSPTLPKPTETKGFFNKTTEEVPNPITRTPVAKTQAPALSKDIEDWVGRQMKNGYTREEALAEGKKLGYIK